MSNDNELRFLTMLVGKLPNRMLIVELGGKKFEVSTKQESLSILLSENYGVVTNHKGLLVDYLADSSLVLFGMIDEDIYDLFVQAVIREALRNGVSRTDVGVLIGAMAESQPEETETLSYLLKGVR